MSADEKRTIAAWVAAGAPEGDPRDLPEPAQYVEGWRIPAPDLVIALPKDRQDPRRGDDALPELHGRPQAQEGRLGAGVAGAAGESLGRPSPGRLRDPARQPRRAQDRLPGRLRARDAAAHPARRRGPARPGRLAADVPGPLHPARHPADRPQRDRPGLRRPEDDPQGDDRGRRDQHGPAASRPAPPTTRPRPDHRFDQDTIALLAAAPHAPARQVVPVRGGLSRRPARGAAGRPAVRVRMAERLRPLRAQADARGDRPALPGPLRQLGRQPVEPRPQADGHLGRADARRDARRLRRGRAGRPGPRPGRADRPASATTAATRSRSATVPRPAPRRSTWPAPSTTGSRPR